MINRLLITAIVIGLGITMIPQSRYIYCQIINTAVDIPIEYQQKLIKNQNRIDEMFLQIGNVRKDNRQLLDELLIMNGIRRRPGERWEISLQDGIWKIFKFKGDAK